MSLARKALPVLLTLGALGGVGCGGSDLTLPSQGVAAKIAITQGNGQNGTVSTLLPIRLLVKVTDSRGQPVPDQRVDFTVTTGGGSAAPTSAATGADGQAGATWTLGPAAGAQSLTATAVGNGAPANLSVAFVASALTAAPAKLTKVAGDGQTAAAGASVATPPSVKVTDADDNPIQGVLVTFAVTGGGGTVSPTAPVATGTNGIAAVTSWRLGPVAGPNQLTATVSGTGVAGSPAVFTATGAVGGANRLAFTVEPVNAAVGAPITPAVEVQIQDGSGNPVTSATNPITISLGTNPSNAALAGTTTVNAVAGVATFSNLNINKPGSGYTLTATSTSGLTGTTSSPFDVVNASSTTTITSISPRTSVVGQPYTVTFTVAAAPPATGTPTGTVTVSDGADGACTGSAPSGNCLLTSTSAGAKSIVATYAGDGNFAGSASPAVTHQVEAAATTALITNAPASSFFGQPITVEFSVSVKPPGAGTPVGNVTVTYQNAGSCTAPVSVGQCSFTPTSAGTRNLRAIFVPTTADFDADQSPNVSLTVNPATTSTAVSSNKNPANAGESITFTAIVTVTQGQGTPTGNVVFKDGNNTFASVPLGGNGSAQATTTLSAGPHSITAQYAGDGNFSGSTSPALLQVVNAVNQPPVAQPDAYSTNEDTPLNQGAPGVLSNDTDPENNSLTAQLVTGPQHAASFVLNSDGSFSYTPAANFNGNDADSFTYRASDGALFSAPVTVLLTVKPVNDPPSFSLAGSNISVGASDGAQVVNNWATGISAGPPDEAGQTVSFEVSNDNPGVFAEQPAIDANGTLTFTPAAPSGTPVTVTVVAKDNGGTANGGNDTSGPQTFTITIN
jgi:large repetitive protein